MGKNGQGREAAPAMPSAVHGKKSQAATVAEPAKQEKEGQEEMRPQGSGMIVRDPKAMMGTLALTLHQARREGTAHKDEIIYLFKSIVLAALLKWRHIRAGGVAAAMVWRGPICCIPTLSEGRVIGCHHGLDERM